MKLRDEVGDVDDATDVDDAEDRLCVWNPSRADIVTPTLRVQNHLCHRLEGLPWKRSAQVRTLDESRAPRRTTWPLHPWADSWRIAVWSLRASPTTTYLVVQLRTRSQSKSIGAWISHTVRDPHHNHHRTDWAHWTTPCQYPHRASRHSLPSQAGHSAHCIQGANAKLHYHGPTVPRYPEAAHGHLHVRLLPAHAQPKWWLQWNRAHHAECWSSPGGMATHSPVIPISRKRVRPLESHRRARCLCLPTSQPRPDRCTPIAGQRSTPPQSLPYRDRKAHRNGRGVQCRKCNCRHALCSVWASFRNHTTDEQK